jgi:glycosyltransferase involved in cell wall biosynthesis
MPMVSVIIPCYNQGQWVQEAIDSVLAQTRSDFEIVVVNDGSTDRMTNTLLEQYQHPLIKVISTSNQGLAVARNNGIAASSGKYILPLDADDRILPKYLELASGILDSHAEIGIVYCYGELFGEREGRITARDFSLPVMMVSNLIFCSAMFRRSSWEATSGYRKEMIYGCEDWDLWLSLIEMGCLVHRIPETLFQYRIRENSMNIDMDKDRKLEMFRLIQKNHPLLYSGWRKQASWILFRLINSQAYRWIKRIT